MNTCRICGIRLDACGCGCNPAPFKCGTDALRAGEDACPCDEIDTSLSLDVDHASLIYSGEKHTDEITGEQLGSIINLSDLRDVSIDNPLSCSLLVYQPGCDACADGCVGVDATWQNYTIPDAGDCIVPIDDEGYYHVLIKNDCGCIEECRLPVVPSGMSVISYMRDSVPDDPDFPWYYGQYNDTINLHLADNAPRYFGKFDLEITVHYGIQVVRPDASQNMNFRSLVVPVVAGESINATQMASTLQTGSTFASTSTGNNVNIPWGSQSLRGSFTFVVPKGKEAYLHHEFRLRSISSFPGYQTNALDGQRVPDDIAGRIDAMLYTASRLNALQVVVRPTSGVINLTPVVDAERSQLDPAVDVYPPLA